MDGGVQEIGSLMASFISNAGKPPAHQRRRGGAVLRDWKLNGTGVTGSPYSGISWRVERPYPASLYGETNKPPASSQWLAIIGGSNVSLKAS